MAKVYILSKEINKAREYGFVEIRGVFTSLELAMKELKGLEAIYDKPNCKYLKDELFGYLPHEKVLCNHKDDVYMAEIVYKWNDPLNGDKHFVHLRIEEHTLNTLE